MRMLLLIVLLYCTSVCLAQDTPRNNKLTQNDSIKKGSNQFDTAQNDSTRNNSTQTDSCNLRISILTCGPGEELYSIFGHSAIRITDASTGMDIVYNYGTMEFDDFSFYVKFTKGQMLYSLSYADMDSFLYEYQVTKRSVIEQQLRLTCEDKMRLFEALKLNAREENKYYDYSFLYDNCSTRIRDIISKTPKSLIRFNNILPAKVPTFRNMIHESLHKGQQHWSKLGIDLLLGSLIDKKVTNEQSMFLPDYLMKGFDSASILIRPDPKALSPLVTSKPYLYQPPVVELSMPWINPYLVLTALSIFLLILSFLHSTSEKTVKLLDKSLFLVTGLLGILMLSLWLFREDTVCRNNMNIIWAIPTHAVAAFFIGKQKKWIKPYFRVSGILGALLLLGWPWWPQELNNSLIPVILLLVIRSFILSKK
ncbi:lipoprotein N-acyltransferase Lnb domain-containing protein [Flavitalea sp.]|nr:DUF4105 domain-containing protein [Flavitalea sp.]